MQSLLLKTQDALSEYRREIRLFLHPYPLPNTAKSRDRFLKWSTAYKSQRTCITKTAQVEKKMTHLKAMCWIMLTEMCLKGAHNTSKYSTVGYAMCVWETYNIQKRLRDVNNSMTKLWCLKEDLNTSYLIIQKLVNHLSIF